MKGNPRELLPVSLYLMASPTAIAPALGLQIPPDRSVMEQVLAR